MATVATEILIVLVAATFIALVFLMGQRSAGRQAAWMTKEEQDWVRKVLRTFQKFYYVKEKEMALKAELKEAALRVSTVFSDLQPSVQSLLAKVTSAVDETEIRDAVNQLNSAADQAVALKAAIDAAMAAAATPATPAA